MFINNALGIPALVTPELSSGLVSVHDITKNSVPVIFTPIHAFILNRNKVAATATWQNPFYRLDKNSHAHVFITNPKHPSPPKHIPSVSSKPIIKSISNRMKTLILPSPRNNNNSSKLTPAQTRVERIPPPSFSSARMPQNHQHKPSRALQTVGVGVACPWGRATISK